MQKHKSKKSQDLKDLHVSSEPIVNVKPNNQLETSSFSPKQRFQFSIKTALLLTAIGAVPFSWVSHCISSRNKFYQTADTIRKNHPNLSILGYNNSHDNNLSLRGRYSFYELITPRYIQGLDGICKGVSDEQFKNIDFKQLSNLLTLRLDTNSLTDDHIGNLSVLTNLDTLGLSSNYLKGTTLHKLKNLPLKELDLSQNPIQSSNLTTFKNTLTLQRLEVRACDFKDQDLNNIAKLKSLQEIDLSANPIQGPGLKELLKLTNLSTLYITSKDLNIDELAYLLEKHPKLDFISLEFDENPRKLEKLDQVALITIRNRVNLMTGKDITTEDRQKKVRIDISKPFYSPYVSEKNN